MNRFISNLKIALESIVANTARSILTGLGIIFGVSAVITMLAIGNGTQQEILKQIDLVGANNIIVVPINDDEDQSSGDANSSIEVSKKFSSGLHFNDAKSILEIIPSIKTVSKEVVYDIKAGYKNQRRKCRLIGVDGDYFDIYHLKLKEGKLFNNSHNTSIAPVCVIGAKLASRLFPGESAIGKWINCSKVYFKVTGVMAHTGISGNDLQSLGVNNYDNEIYAPIQSVLTRYKNRSLITAKDLVRSRNRNGTANKEKKSIHQLDKLIIQMENTAQINEAVVIMNKLLLRHHNNVADFEIKVPEQLLQQKKETNDLFNLLLGAIASISLLVGGIGIMNIMLASVMERIKEIGLRMAVGAQQSDIRTQFVLEAVLISVTGGFFGVILGVCLSYFIHSFLDMPIAISWLSIVLSFGVSAGVGIIFGYMPANKAAKQDPVKSLRYE